METLAQLLDRGETYVAVLVRARDQEEANGRVRALLARLYDRPPVAAARVRAVPADLERHGLALAPSQRCELVECVDRVVHCAASISFEEPLSRARAVNLDGLSRVLELAGEIEGLRRMVHVSTAFVGGRREGTFSERDLDLSADFRNTYEQSKAEGEWLIASTPELPVVVARPSMVVGHSAGGWTPVFNNVYWPIRAFERGLFRTIPTDPGALIDIVPVDYVAAAIVALCEADAVTGTYALVAGDRALSAAELLQRLVTGDAAPSPPVPLSTPGRGDDLPVGAASLAPYFDVRCRFGDERARAVLAPLRLTCPDPRSYLAELLAYARRTRWGKLPLSRQAAMGERVLQRTASSS